MKYTRKEMQKWVENNVALDIKNYRINPLLHGAKVYIFILLLSEFTHNFNIWQEVYIYDKKN